MLLTRRLATNQHAQAVLRRIRKYATVDSATIIARPPRPPAQSLDSAPTLNSSILTALSENPPQTALPDLIRQYVERSSHVLDISLPYEPQPSEHRRVKFDDSDGVVMVVHCAQAGDRHNISVCSGFALEQASQAESESIIITCAHTLEEIRWSPLLPPDLPAETSQAALAHCTSGTFVISGDQESTLIQPVSGVLSALRRSDLLLLSRKGNTRRTYPISPYPAQAQTRVRAHFVSETRPDEPGWTPWLGGTWSKWVSGIVLGYRDFSGREAKPGTYDALSHMLFSPPPTAGSSGGPIVDEESGAVVGVMLGTRMDNRVEGMRGWGVPSETMFEMFNLPGLEGKS